MSDIKEEQTPNGNILSAVDRLTKTFIKTNLNDRVIDARKNPEKFEREFDATVCNVPDSPGYDLKAVINIPSLNDFLVKENQRVAEILGLPKSCSESVPMSSLQTPPLSKFASSVLIGKKSKLASSGFFLLWFLLNRKIPSSACTIWSSKVIVTGKLALIFIKSKSKSNQLIVWVRPINTICWCEFYLLCSFIISSYHVPKFRMDNTSYLGEKRIYTTHGFGQHH